MRILIYSGTHVQTEENRDIVRLWGRLTTALNPDIDIVVFDSCSPFDPARFLPPSIEIVRFKTNPGHLSQGGGDGAGRTFCEGIHYAHTHGYDYCVHLESDMLLAKPIAPLIEKMSRDGVMAAACYLPQYQFFEFGICAFDVHRMIANDFIGRYDWQSAPKWPIPERRIGDLLENELWIIPWHGTRNDQHQINPHTFSLAFPYSAPTWITHVSMPVALKFLELNGIEVADCVGG